MRLPHLNDAASSHAAWTSAARNGAAVEFPPSRIVDGINPQGCCGVRVCVPLVGCHCEGVESPLCG